MAFFEKLSETVTNTGVAVGGKAKELTEIAKIKNAIATEERKIKEQYEEIGKLYVEKYAENEDALFQENIKKIKESKRKIEEKNLELNKVKQVKVCPACGAKVSEESAFCSNCGTKVE